MKIKSFPKSCLSIFIATICVCLSSCNESPTNSETPIYYLTTSVGGIINNLSPEAKIIKVLVRNKSMEHVMSSGTVAADNSFNLDLTVPPDGFLIDIDDFATQNLITTITISDHTVKVSPLYVNAYDSSGNFKGYLTKINHLPGDSLAFGQMTVSAFYCDKNLTLTGRNKVIFGNDTTTVNYNAYLAAGWNVTTLRTIVVREHLKEFEFFGGELHGPSWYFVPAPFKENESNDYLK